MSCDRTRGGRRRGDRAPALLAALLLGALAAGTPAHAAGLAAWLGIEGRDDRDAVRFNGGWPWVAIGRLDRADGAHCSGTLIARDTVLTAAHCLEDETGRRFEPSDFTFAAGRDGVDARAEARVVAIGTGARPALRHGPDDAAAALTRDWAVLTLDRSLYDGGWLRPVALIDADRARRLIADGAELAQAGYSGDRSGTLTRNRTCSAAGLAGSGALVLHHCDATFGDSGSPLLVEDGGEWAILAIHVAVSRHAGRTTGIAVIPDAGARP